MPSQQPQHQAGRRTTAQGTAVKKALDALSIGVSDNKTTSTAVQKQTAALCAGWCVAATADTNRNTIRESKLPSSQQMRTQGLGVTSPTPIAVGRKVPHAPVSLDHHLASAALACLSPAASTPHLVPPVGSLAGVDCSTSTGQGRERAPHTQSVHGVGSWWRDTHHAWGPGHQSQCNPSFLTIYRADSPWVSHRQHHQASYPLGGLAGKCPGHCCTPVMAHDCCPADAQLVQHAAHD